MPPLQRLADYLDDLLDTSRLITGNLHLTLSPTEVVPTIEAAIEVVRPAAEAKSITIETRFTSDVASITCDTQRLQQMVWNLLTNAVKFTPDNGRIEVESKAGKAEMRALVTDMIHPEGAFMLHGYGHKEVESKRSYGKGVPDSLFEERHYDKIGGSPAMDHTWITVKKI